MRWIERCLQCIRQSTVPVVPVVVDNASVDATRDYVPSHFSEVVWLPQEKNLGFGQGNNIGIRYAMEHEADYVLLLNQDAYLQPTAVEEMLKIADGRNLVSPLHLNGDGSRLDTMFKASLCRAENSLLDDLLFGGAVSPLYVVGEVCAACWFMPINMLKEIGGFNPLFFQYGEDNNYYTRLVYHNRQVLVAAKARVFHDRRIHGNVQLYNKKEVHLKTLVCACNINLTLSQRLYRWCSIGVHAPVRFLIEWMSLVPCLVQILRSRREEKKRQPCWL
ncbi:MAG: glycosyltransferase family 2 protein [Bacteroidaceae bacterium]|nr:glycosyltransferase family 2 protein [Bacteroidaceae bacterium]